MPPDNSSASPVKPGGIRMARPLRPCERHRDAETSKAVAASGPVAAHFHNESAPDSGSKSQRAKTRMALGWLCLLVIPPLALVTAYRMADKASDGAPGSSTRIGWYFSSGQWLADIHTFTAACEFIMEVDVDAPAGDHPPNNHSARNPGIEATSNSRGRSQSETGVN